MLLCIGFISCSDDDNPKTDNPITGLEIPQSSSDNPVKSGESVTIKGTGFTQTSEIWLRVVTKSSESSDVKAEVTSVTASSISFTAPTVSGERVIVLKQSGQEYSLGKIYFEDSNETIIKKRITQWFRDGELFHEFSYDKDGRLEKFNEAGELHEYAYNQNGQLISEIRYDEETKKKTSTTVFEYKNATTIVVTKTDHQYPEIDIQTLTLNEKGQLIKRVCDDQANEYEYDVAGNLIKNIDSWLNWDGKEESQTLTYKYDEKKSYFSNQGVPLWYWVYNDGTGFDCYGGANNMIGSKNDGDFMEAFKFDYDEDGYPTVKYEDEEGDGNFTKECEFIYEVIK